MSIQDKDLPRAFRAFLWKTLHNAHKIGGYWEYIPNHEHKANCERCGETDDMDHIMLRCPASGQETIWALAKELWERKHKGKTRWPTMTNVGSITRCALAHFVQGKKPKPGDNRLYKFLIAESAMLIWILRIERVYKGEQEQTTEEIRARWVAKINERLKLDRAATHKKYDKQKTDRDLVLKTWSGTLKNESLLPDDWIETSGVLVGLEARERRGACLPADPP